MQPRHATIYANADPTIDKERTPGGQFKHGTLFERVLLVYKGEALQQRMSGLQAYSSVGPNDTMAS